MPLTVVVADCDAVPDTEVVIVADTVGDLDRVVDPLGDTVLLPLPVGEPLVVTEVE